MNSFPGLYRGVVTNNNDPEGFFRIKAIVPQVFGNTTTETDWAWPCFPPGWTAMPSSLLKQHPSQSISGTGSGVDSNGDTFSVTIHMTVPLENHALDLSTPNPGAGVWVAFEGGDPERAIWMGVWQ